MEQIEIFRTNVNRKEDAVKIIRQLNRNEPAYDINFDIDDCDRILRIESKSKKVNVQSVIEFLKNNNFTCEVLN